MTKILARLSSVLTTILAGLSSIMAAVLAWLSSALTVILGWLSSLDGLSLSEVFAKLSFVDQLLLVVAASQVVMFVLATLVEFSARKRRRIPILEPAAEQKLAATPSEILSAEERVSQPTVHAPPAATLAEPVIEAKPTEAVVEAAPAEPVSEVRPAEPVVETAPAETLVKGPPVEAVIETAPAQTVVEAPPVEPVAPPVAVPPKAPARIGLGLRRTRENLLARIRAAITGSAKLDEVCEGLEEALIAADVGVQASLKLVEAVRTRVKDGTRPDAIREALKDEIARMLVASERPMNIPAQGPLVIMLAGVNGVGKTTTVAKLAARMKVERGPVIVAAADTFRAAAIEQLEVWCGRVGAARIKKKNG
jgi:fused signal recognition particle receptor